jgi:two-component system alkaline phosphatase synthesis response regulator PhoP
MLSLWTSNITPARINFKNMNKEDIKILIVDDENDILEFLSYNLKREGYQVFVCDNGKDAITKAKEIKPQLILLDVMMPELDGIETCIQIRSDKSLADTLIAFLTARNEDYSQIAGFDAGADDYINKPIKPKVLLSRIAGVLRRFLTNEKDIQGEIGGLVLDREKFIVFKDGLPVSLPKKEFELMALLMSKPGKVFLREEILDKVWGGDVVVGDRTIDVHIRKLREKLGENYIKTIKGVGYKFDL